MNTAEATENQGMQIFQQTLTAAVTLPGVRINRAAFLSKELSKHCPQAQVVKAIAANPAEARIPRHVIDQIANGCIAYETTKVTALSAAAGIPGGFAVVGTVPADLVQYFGHILRVLQKLAYLYGWGDLLDTSAGELDDATVNLLTLFIGVMFGAQGAGKVIARISQTAAASVEKRLVNTALTKTAIYPVVKKTMGYIGIKINKEIFSKGVSKMVPVLGGVISGGVTLGSFLPMAKKLQGYLQTLPMCDVDYYREQEKQPREERSPVVDAEFQET